MKNSLEVYESVLLERFHIQIHHEDELIHSLQLSFAQDHEKKETAPACLEKLIQELIEYLEGKRQGFSHFPICYGECSDFSRELYEELKKISYGALLTYGELAQRLGDKKLARAVGTCVGKNPIMILIPCHRIVGENTVGGFSSPDGILMKDFLLRLEGAILA